MKQILIIITLVLTSVPSNAQDIITVNNGKEIEYEKGKFYIGITQLTEREVKVLFKDTPALAVYNQSIKIKKTGKWFIIGGSVLLAGGFAYYATPNRAYEFDYQGVTFPLGKICDSAIVLGSTAIVGSIYFYVKSGSLRKKSASVYNQSLNKSNNNYSLNVGLVGNGIGFSVNF